MQPNNTRYRALLSVYAVHTRIRIPTPSSITLNQGKYSVLTKSKPPSTVHSERPSGGPSQASNPHDIDKVCYSKQSGALRPREAVYVRRLLPCGDDIRSDLVMDPVNAVSTNDSASEDGHVVGNLPDGGEVGKNFTLVAGLEEEEEEVVFWRLMSQKSNVISK